MALLLCSVMLLAACGPSNEGPSGSGTSGSGTSGGGSSGGGASGGTPERALRDTFNIAVNETVDQIDCGNVKLNTAHKVVKAIYDPLIYPADESGEFTPCLATSWEQKDDVTLIFHLRDDVYFHNGEKLTAEDVVFSIQRSCELPNNRTLFKAFDPENTKALDDLTVEVKFLYPFAAALNYLSSGRGGIVSKKAVEEMGNDAFGLAPVGTGPFKFAKWVEGDRIVLERFEEYWGEKPSYKTLNFRFITDDSVRAMELEAGGIDAMFVVAPQDYERLSANPDIVTYTENGYTTLMLQFNVNAEEFSDVRVRQALACSIDTTTIVKAVYGDLGAPADGLYTDQIFAYLKLGPVQRDVEKAKALLAEAGYENGFKTEITVPEGTTIQNILEIAQAQWKEAGIEVAITIYDTATMSARNAAGETKFGRTNWTAVTGDPDHAMTMWNSTYGGVMQMNDPHMDELMEKGLGEFDPAKRKEIYQELQEYCWNTFYSIPIVFPKETFAHAKYVEGFEFKVGNSPYCPFLHTINIYEK